MSTRHTPQRRQQPAKEGKQDKDVVSSGSVLSASVTGASYLILLQVFTRLLTFTFNQLILRHTTPSIFGFATIQLELLSSTILFLSREAFRIALQRDRGALQRTINLAYIPFVLGLIAGLVGCYGFYRGADDGVRELGGFGWSIILYGLATVVELFVEPCFAVAQQMMLFRVRTLAEGIAVVGRCAVTFLVTVYFSRQGRLSEYGALPFGLGQLAYAVVLAGVYLFIISKRVNLLPRRIKSENSEGTYLFHRPTLWLAASVTGQSLFKHLLTEGDKLVLTFLTTPYTQGIYAIVSNYGSPPIDH
jgi:oligosaccharide translocation protein RFT1